MMTSQTRDITRLWRQQSEDFTWLGYEYFLLWCSRFRRFHALTLGCFFSVLSTVTGLQLGNCGFVFHFPNLPFRRRLSFKLQIGEVANWIPVPPDYIFSSVVSVYLIFWCRTACSFGFVFVFVGVACWHLPRLPGFVFSVVGVACWHLTRPPSCLNHNGRSLQASALPNICVTQDGMVTIARDVGRMEPKMLNGSGCKQAPPTTVIYIFAALE